MRYRASKKIKPAQDGREQVKSSSQKMSHFSQYIAIDRPIGPCLKTALLPPPIPVVPDPPELIKHDQTLEKTKIPIDSVSLVPF